MDVDPGLEPMEAQSAADIPLGPGWQYEPKWDGFRCLAFRDGDAVELRSKSGQTLGRYFPDIVTALGALPARRFVVDGELLVPVDGVPSFEHTQMRLHPAASRVQRLSAEHPARYVLFDLLLGSSGDALVGEPLGSRRAALEAFAAANPSDGVTLSPASEDPLRAQEWLRGEAGCDGVMAKRLDMPYRAGLRDGMVKVKRLRSADCVVGGFRTLQRAPQVGSLLLGLYDDQDRLDHVGFTSAIADHERAALTERLQTLAGASAFTARAPGAPSRWSRGRSAEWHPVRPELVVEVAYDHVSGGRFRHGTRLLRFRPDKAPRQCRIGQIAPPLPLTP